MLKGQKLLKATWRRDFSTYGKGFMEAYGADGKGGNRDQRAQNKLFGFYRTMGEAGIVLMFQVLITIILDNILANEGDDDELRKKIEKLC